VNKIKLIFIINTVTNYQIDFFNFVKKFFSIKVLFYSREHKNYKFIYKKESFFSYIEDYPKKKFYFNKIITNFKPHFVVLGGYKLKYNNFIIKLLKKNKIKFFYWLERLDERNKIKLKVIDFFFRSKLRNADGIFAVGNQATRFYRKYNKNILNLPYSINIRKSYNRNYFINDKINFLFIGQLIKRKGADLILKIINNLDKNIHDKITFTIIGNGPLNNKFKKLSFLKANLKYISFRNKRELWKFYLKNDVLLFPSRFDGWGVVPMEAMSNGMFLVISKYSGVKEILKYENNFIVKDENTLINAIIKCVNNRSIIKKQGSINRSLIMNSICNAQNASHLLKTYLTKYDNRN
jgi:glycosyltransferase involved in cell wall biosynthesis